MDPSDSSLRIRPSLVVLDASSGKIASSVVSIENRGNLDLTVDLAGAYPLGREEPLAADPGDPVSALEVLTAALSRVPRVLTQIGTLHLDQPDGPQTLLPGATAIMRIEARWDQPLDPAHRYRAFVPVYGADLALAIVTAVKRDGTAKTPGDTPARRPPSKRN